MKWSTIAGASLVLFAGSCTTLLGINRDYVEQKPTDEAGLEGGGDGDGANVVSGDGATPDGGDAADAGSVDSGACKGHICDGLCYGGTTCTDCASARLYCAASHTCVVGCAACPVTAAVACYDCTSGTPVGTCEPKATATCLHGLNNNCSCDGGASLCPGDTQVCSNGQCMTCGVPSLTDGQKCKNSTTCDEGPALCH